MHSIDGIKFQTQQSVSRQAALNSSPMYSGSESVLLIDDEETITLLAKRMLEFLGYTVTTFTNGAEAFQVFADHPERFDVVIMDQAMPSMTGVELALEMLRIRPEIPFVLMSGYRELEMVEAAEQAGIHEFLPKPFVARELGEAIRRALEINR
jgi:DNA-binding NtrC family response regulator